MFTYSSYDGTSAIFNPLRYLSCSIITTIFVIVTKHSLPLANILQLPQRGNPDWLPGLKAIANLVPRLSCNSHDKRYGTNSTRFEGSSYKNISLVSMWRICTFRWIFQGSTHKMFYAHFPLLVCFIFGYSPVNYHIIRHCHLCIAVLYGYMLQNAI